MDLSLVNTTSSKSNKFVKDILIIFLGSSLLGLAYSKWMVPNEIINGGVTSIAMILQKLSNIPILYLTNGLTIFLLIMCLLFLGKETFLKSVFSGFFYSTSFSLFHTLNFSLQINPIVDLLFASIIISIGFYFCIATNSSTVSVDIIALILHRKNNSLDVAKTIKQLNFIVLIIAFLVYGIKPIVIGFIFTFMYSKLLSMWLKYDPLKINSM